jgi:hypothetical protein
MKTDTKTDLISVAAAVLGQKPAENHTALPWSVGGTFFPDSPYPKQNIWGPTPEGAQSGQIVAENCSPRNADFIVGCVNAHAALVSALEEALAWHDLDDNRAMPVRAQTTELGRNMLSQARAALALVKQ